MKTNKCIVCSKKFVPNKTKKGYLKFCSHKCYIKLHNQKENIAKKNRKNRKRWSKCIYGRYHSYKYGAKSRKIIFNLTFEEFKKFWKKRCYYCNSKIDTIGLDRINSKIGYVKDNIVPCCTICNRMKLDMSEQFFIGHCKKIIKNYKGLH